MIEYDSRKLCSSRARRFQVLGASAEEKKHGASIPFLPGELRAFEGFASLLGLLCLQQCTRVLARSRACRTGWGTSSLAARTIEQNVISTSALASRPGEPAHQNRLRRARIRDPRGSDFLRAAGCGIGAGGPKNKYLPICVISPAFLPQNLA